MIVIRGQIKGEKNRPSQRKLHMPSVNRQNTGLKEVRFNFFLVDTKFSVLLKNYALEEA